MNQIVLNLESTFRFTQYTQTHTHIYINHNSSWAAVTFVLGSFSSSQNVCTKHLRILDVRNICFISQPKTKSKVASMPMSDNTNTYKQFRSSGSTYTNHFNFTKNFRFVYNFTKNTLRMFNKQKRVHCTFSKNGLKTIKNLRQIFY